MQQGYPRWRGFAIGFASGALSSLGGSAFMMYGGKFANSKLGMYTFSGLTGGIAAEAIGGNFWEGAATGATGGLVSGFVTGAGNAWNNGANFGDGLTQGLISGGIGAGIGGLISGLSSGISSSLHNGDFWTGEGAIFDQIATTSANGNTITVGEGMEYSNSYAKQFSDDYFGKIKGLDNLYADGTLPKNSGYTKIGDIVFNTKQQMISGTTAYNGIGKGSNVYLYKTAFTSAKHLYSIMGHEYIHVAQNAAGLPFNGMKREHAAWNWTYRQDELFGTRTYNLSSIPFLDTKYYDPLFDYSKYKPNKSWLQYVYP